MILACQNIEKAFVAETVIRQASFYIEEHEKAALIGINGAGKSTLLRIITGEMKADAGQVTLARGMTLGYLAQQQDVSGISASTRRSWRPNRTFWIWNGSCASWKSR